MLAGTGIPVVPCFLSGAFDAWPKGRTIPRPSKLTLHIGSPRTYGNAAAGKDGALSIAADLEQAVAALRR